MSISKDTEIKELNIQGLLMSDFYRIPIYQRNYDWGEKESMQLIEDIADYAQRKRDKTMDNKLNYYIGSLVVFKRRDSQGCYYFETIDGQQRLTTLTILLCALINLDRFELDTNLISWYRSPNLSFDHRDISDNTIKHLFDNKFFDLDTESNIVEVYNILQKGISSILDSHSLTINEFVDYLLHKVIILRVPLPADTQLNHYFEVMNSRGEQLEKHEVLKASLMAHLNVETHQLFNEIWEACANMDKYVQMEFENTKVRSMIFSQWEDLAYDDFDSLYDLYCHLNDDEDSEEINEAKTLSSLLADAKANVHYNLPSDADYEKQTERFSSVINFPNFLLHVLKIYCHNQYSNIEYNVVLDDKRLIDIFQAVLKAVDDKKNFVKGFIMELIRMRYLFDKYVIKREVYKGEKWSLKRLKRYANSKTNYVTTFNGDNEEDNEANKDIRMLEAMFHVSAPTQIYKYWLNAVLFIIRSDEHISADELRFKLYSLAKCYMLDEYLCEKEDRQEFFDIIYKNGFLPQNMRINWNNINRGCAVGNFVFNFYDYILWHSGLPKQSATTAFEFTYRTSVEHFYPQQPMTGYDNLKDKGLDDFGNLCLISRGMNSKFSNNMPLAKVADYGNESDVLLSLKLQHMMTITRQHNSWGTNEINEYEEFAKMHISKYLGLE